MLLFDNQTINTTMIKTVDQLFNAGLVTNSLLQTSPSQHFPKALGWQWIM